MAGCSMAPVLVLPESCLDMIDRAEEERICCCGEREREGV